MLGVLWDVSHCVIGAVTWVAAPCHHGKHGKLKILLHFRGHTHSLCTHILVHIHTQNAEKHSPTHKHPSVTLIMLTPTAKLCRRHLIPDNSAIFWHKPTQMRSHSCTQTHTFFFFLSSSCSVALSGHILCPLLQCLFHSPNSPTCSWINDHVEQTTTHSGRTPFT